MGKSSSLAYWAHVKNNTFDADRPVSTAYSWLTRQNTSHLVDSAGQYLIHWCGNNRATGGDDFAERTLTAVGDQLRWMHVFPFHPYQDAIPGFDIRISAKGTALLFVSARILYDDLWPFDQTPGSAGSTELWSSSVSVPAAGVEAWVIDEQFFGVKPSDFGRSIEVVESSEPGSSFDRQVESHVLRLEVFMVSDSPGVIARLLGVQLRQFPVWF